jgi:hypothetical protein
VQPDVKALTNPPNFFHFLKLQTGRVRIAAVKAQIIAAHTQQPSGTKRAVFGRTRCRHVIEFPRATRRFDSTQNGQCSKNTGADLRKTRAECDPFAI